MKYYSGISLYFCLLFSTAWGQDDSIKFHTNDEIIISVSNGFYNLKTIDSARYKQKSIPFSFGFLYSRSLSERLKLSTGVFYSTNKFELADFPINPPQNIVLEKSLAYLDIPAILSFELVQKSPFFGSVFMGFFFNQIIKGRYEVSGILPESYYTNPPYPRYQFNNSERSAILGSDFKLLSGKRFLFDSKFSWRYYFRNIVWDEKTGRSTFNFMIGVGYML